jgi:hypothetical protein
LAGAGNQDVVWEQELNVCAEENEEAGGGRVAGPAHASRWAQAAYQTSERRMSRLVLMQRSTLRYRGHRDRQEGLRTRLRELAATRLRFGYRQLTVLTPQLTR